MLTPELASQVRRVADQASVKAEEYSGVLGTAQGWILDNFGQNGLYAAYIGAAVVILFLVAKLAKLTFSAVKYLVIPALALAFLASLFTPFSFAAALPISVTVCSLFLLFKG
ncbi:hypothetical protein GF377_11135 [candidate division GN15 bacterium]|nr:hypothetical protein [candidate division GN15 bacterium]